MDWLSNVLDHRCKATWINTFVTQPLNRMRQNEKSRHKNRPCKRTFREIIHFEIVLPLFNINITINNYINLTIINIYYSHLLTPPHNHTLNVYLTIRLRSRSGSKHVYTSSKFLWGDSQQGWTRINYRFIEIESE